MVTLPLSPDRISVTPQSTGLYILEGGPATTTFEITNHGDRDARIHPWLSVPRGFRATVDPERVSVPAGGSRRVSARVVVTDQRMPRGSLTLHAGDALAWVSMIATDNWVQVATMSASSHHPYGFEAQWAQDGWTWDEYRWNKRFGWVDGTGLRSGEELFPDWLAATWPQPLELTRVRVITRSSPHRPAESYGLRDYDVQVRSEDSWTTVAEVRDNVEGTIDSRFSPVSTTGVRIYIFATNDGKHSRVVELEAYRANGRPTPRLLETYGGPGAPFPA